ncbi:hypothetical protein NPIL_446831 [Nephila pilipes]|uniref:Reverse transcriptase domain-containing protein n=1 Tax=Nephila pilipes TaxID=299642 RepID=A0A8X6R1W9_NEPPI|nr:hypothetical protein NPIL_446831 [Nephila pilipes]
MERFVHVGTTDNLMRKQYQTDTHTIPRIQDFHHILKNITIFSKIDLIKAYYQIPIGEDDKYDILIASTNERQHEDHLKIIFERLNSYGLIINISKSVFGVQEIEFLGYLISKEGSRPLPEKVQAIINYKKPENLHDLRTFLGMINFYRRYLKDAAKTQTLLYDYLIRAKKRDTRKIQRSDEAEKQFEKCKNYLIDTALLSFPKPESPLALFTDASDTDVGSVLQQLENDTWKPIEFYSKKKLTLLNKISAHMIVNSLVFTFPLNTSNICSKEQCIHYNIHYNL